MLRNIAGQHVAAQVINIDGDPVTASVGVRVTIDGGTPGDGAGTTTHKEAGHWDYAPTQGETDCEHLCVRFEPANGIFQLVNVYPLDVELIESAAEQAIIDQGVVTITDLPEHFDDLAIAETTGEVLAGNLGTVEASSAAAQAAAEAVAAKLPTKPFLTGSDNADGSIAATVEGAVTVSSLQPSAIAQLAGVTIRVDAPVRSGRFLELVRGDDYFEADGRAIEFTLSGLTADFTNATAKLTLRLANTEHTFNAAGVEVAGDDVVVRVELTAAQTGALTPSIRWKYDLQIMLDGGHVLTPIVTERCTVHEDYTS